jgi:hypothetical protein
MYSKEELKTLKTNFWNTFKAKMSHKRSSNGRKMNWLNYPSEVPFIFIRLDTDHSGARLIFDIQSKDEGVRAIIWEQLYELKVVMESEMGSEGLWLENCSSPFVKSFNRIMWERKDLSFYRPEDHTEIMQFLEDRLIHFDIFYQDFKDVLTNLAN